MQRLKSVIIQNECVAISEYCLRVAPSYFEIFVQLEQAEWKVRL